MSSMVLEIDDWPVTAAEPAIIAREATYFLLMTGSDCDVTFYSKGTAIGRASGLQGGDGVGPLSRPYDKIQISSATSQTVKVATTSDPVTITRLSGVVQIDGVVETTSDYSRVIRDEVFYLSAIQQSVAGEFSSVQFWNSMANNKNLIITDIFCEFPTSLLTDITDVEAMALNLNNFIEKKATSMLGQPVVSLSNENYVKRGTSAVNTTLQNSNGLRLGSQQKGWANLKQPFVIQPGSGLAFTSRAVNEEIAISAMAFEV